MISRIRVQGLGSLADVDVKLGPLTLLIGPNASGKSRLIQALVLLSRIVRSPIRGPKGELKLGHAALDDLVFRGDPARTIGIEAWIDGTEGAPTYAVEIGRSEGFWTVLQEEINLGEWSFASAKPFEFPTERRGIIRWDTPGYPPRHGTLPYLVYAFRDDRVAFDHIRPLLELQSKIGYAFGYHVNPVDLVTPTLPPWIAVEDPHVDQTGTGFPYALQRWIQTVDGARTFQQQVLPALQNLFPHITGVGLRGGGPRLFVEYAATRSERPIPAHLESDGVNMTLFFLTIPYILSDNLAAGGDAPICLCFEEPETGTHPRLQNARLDLLRAMAHGEVLDRALQIVATTHSVDLIRWVRRDEAIDVLRFVEHLGDERGTQIHRATKQEDIDRIWEIWQGDLGAAWYSGVFGGVPQ